MHGKSELKHCICAVNVFVFRPSFFGLTGPGMDGAGGLLTSTSITPALSLKI